MQNGREDSPQTLQNTKNELALSAQVHTLDIGLKVRNFAINYRHFPTKETQSEPKPQNCEKELNNSKYSGLPLNYTENWHNSILFQSL